MKTKALFASCLLLVSCLLCGFGLPIPDEWAERDTEFDISISAPDQDPGFTIPWQENEDAPVIIPIPDTTGADDDITIVPIEPNNDSRGNGMTIIPIS